MATWKFIAVVALVAMVGWGRNRVEAGSGSDSREQQRESCGCLVTKPNPTGAPTDAPSPSPSGSSGNVTYDCPLVRALKEICDELQSEDDDDADEFCSLVEEIEQDLQDADDNSLEADEGKHGDKKCVRAAYKLKKHMKKKPQLKKKIHYKDNIKGCNGQRWGYIRDFIKVTIMIQSESSKTQITLDVDDDCPLFRAIRNGSSASGNTTVQDECEELIAELKVVLKCGCGYSHEQEMSMIYKLIKKKFSHLMEFLFELDIEGFGPLESLVDVCKVEHQILTIDKVIGGDDAPLLKKLKKLYEDQSIEITIRVTIKQMCDSINASFQETDDVQTRLNNCSVIIHEFRKLAPWIVPVIFDAELEFEGCNESSEEEDDEGEMSCVWGDIYELEFCSNMCSNYGTCGGAGGGEGTPKPPSTPSVPTTTAAPTTSEAPTTTVASTVAPTSGPSCPDRPSVCTVNPSCNCSRILVSIEAVRVTWSFSQQTSFSATYAGCKQAVYNHVNYPTMKSKINKLRDLFMAWNPSGTNYNQQLMNIVITKSDGNAWGKVKDFCDCGVEP